MDKLILSLLIFLPVFGAILMMPISKYIGKDKIKWTALITAGLQLILAFWLYLNFNPASTIENSPFTVNVEWIKHFNIFYYVGVDGLSMPMVMLTALLSFICIIASWNIDKKPLGYFSLFFKALVALCNEWR